MSQSKQKMTEHPMPTFSWEALERVLTTLAASEDQRALVAPALSAHRKQAVFYAPEMLLRELVILAWLILDESWSETATGPIEST